LVGRIDGGTIALIRRSSSAMSSGLSAIPLSVGCRSGPRSGETRAFISTDLVSLVSHSPCAALSLAARHLEENGIATVVTGCAKDIVEYVGVPRFLFSDFPLGNATGRPKDPQSQALTLELALRVLESAPAARTTVQSPLRWRENPSWKFDYSNIERLSPEEIRLRRQEFDQQKEIAKNIRDGAA
jgi:D-proline reductase (dithiol) PrdB